METQAGLANPMLGSQLVSKSILVPTLAASCAPQQQNGLLNNNNNNNNNNSSNSNSNSKEILANRLEQAEGQTNVENPTSKTATSEKKQQVDNKQENFNQEATSTNQQETSSNGKQLKSISCQTNPPQHERATPVKQRQLLLEANNAATSATIASSNSSSSIAKNNSNNMVTATATTPTTSASDNNHKLSARDLELLTKETQDYKNKNRKLQLEIDEKNEIINVLKDELEATKEQNDKFQRDNIQLVKDSKRVKFLQDENDFLQDKVGNVDKLELEIKRLKEKLSELDFLKLRIGELEEDTAKAQEESLEFETKWKEAEIKLKRVAELEAELSKWKSFSHELELERNSIQTKLLESIEQETKLNSINKQVEDEVKRLRSLIRSYEEQRDEEQASNSLIMSVADLKQLDHQRQSSSQQRDLHGDTCIATATDSSPILADTSIKFELDKQLEKELNEENRNMKQKLNEQDDMLNELTEKNKVIRDELDSNRKIISDLRQDLACEKSLTAKLANQLTSFTKQIKNLDKQYFPMHDASSPTTTDASNKLCVTKSNNLGGKQSSLLESVTTATAATTAKNGRQQQPDATIEAISKRMGDIQLQCNNNSVEGNAVPGPKTKQQPVSSNKDGNKSSAQPKESTTENYLQLDNDIKSGKQSITQAVDSNGIGELSEKAEVKTDLLSIAIEQTEAKPSTLAPVMTNKSAASAVAASPETCNKDKDEGLAKSRLLSAATNNNDGNNDGCNMVASNATSLNKTSNQTETPRRSLFSSPLESNGEDEREAKRKLVHVSISVNSNNGDSNNRSCRANAVQHLTSVSPNSNARSQSSSPSAANAIGHDSGFQSINNDFNQNSPPGVEARKATLKSTVAAATASQHGQAAVAVLADTASSVAAVTACQSQPIQPSTAAIESTGVIKKRTTAATTAPPKPNRSTPIVAGKNHVATITAAETVAVAESSALATIERRSPATPPTHFKNTVPSAGQSQGANPVVLGQIADGSQKNELLPLPVQTANTAATGKSSAISAATKASTSSLKAASSGLASKSAAAATSVDSAQRRSKPKSSDTANLLNNRSKVAGANADDDDDDDEEEKEDYDDEESDNISEQKRAPTPVKSARTPLTSSSNFVRNSLPCRSVNFGHSKSSAYLDRIRASVTATTKTNTTSSFNEQTSRNVVLSQQQPVQQQQVLRPQADQPQYVLNCLLDHQHSERCFVLNDGSRKHLAQVHSSQVTVSDPRNRQSDSSPMQSSRQVNALIDPISHERLMLSILQQHQHQHQNQQHPQQHQHLQQDHAAQNLHRPSYPQQVALGGVGSGDLNEKQLAHLASLHHQHYYHHLQHMHQLHQLHHMQLHHHRLHHTYQPQQTGSTNGGAGLSPTHQQAASVAAASPVAATTNGKSQQHQSPVATAQRRQQHCELPQPLYSGSQFYAQFDQVYANMTANNSINQLNEQNNPQQHQQSHRTRLVNDNHHQHQHQHHHHNHNHNHNHQHQHNHKQQQQQFLDSTGGSGSEGSLRSSPSRSQSARTSPQKLQQQQSHYAALPQIDEINGLPTSRVDLAKENVVGLGGGQRTNSTPTKHQKRSAQVVMTSDASSASAAKSIVKQQTTNSFSNGSPSSSSPTSSTSPSNLSASSASSSSSLNSISASSAPLNRSALRHTTTNMTRRQFSVERELVGTLPMTATLSRVGSCRAGRQSGNSSDQQANSLMCHARHPSVASHHQQVQLDGQLPQMRTPVKSQQPPMRTSKILSIGQQSTGAVNGQHLTASGAQPALLPQVGCATKTSAATTPISGSSSPEKRNRKSNGTGATGDGTPNKSSLWFEYGCV